MKLLTAITGILLVCLLFTYTSCTNQSSGFKTKQDSLSFAKAYFDRYPDENSVKVKYQSTDSIYGKGFSAITWATVQDYEARYDKQPIIYSPVGVPLQGFTIDTTGYRMIAKNPLIKGLYLRFGKKPDGAFTIMVLGTNAKGKLMKDSMQLKGLGGDTNFDDIPPCPTTCPGEPD